jgi:uncharacterized delta-60 repeat protein
MSNITVGQCNTIDATFQPSEIGHFDKINGQIWTTHAQSDGKILVGGPFYSCEKSYFMRLNANGSLDSAFSPVFKFDQSPNTSWVNIFSIITQTDGKIIIGGRFQSVNGTPRFNIVRLNYDGSVDDSFLISNGTNGDVQKVLLQSDGKIIIGGAFTEVNGVPSNNIARLNQDGSLDQSFSIGTGFTDAGGFGGFNSAVSSMDIQADGKIIVAGGFSQYNGNTLGSSLIRLNLDGSFDPTFDIYNNIDQNGNYASVYLVKIQDDGKIICAGSGGLLSQLFRLNDNGTIDNSFNITLGFDSPSINDIKIGSNGTLIIAGGFTSYNGQSRNHILRLYNDGTLDNTFNIGSGINGTYDWVNSISMLTDQSIILGGTFYSYNGNSAHNLIKINSNGDLMNDFNNIIGSRNFVNRIISQDDGKIVITGTFILPNELTNREFLRLYNDGQIDNSFSPEIVLNYDSNIQKLSNGKFYVWGGGTTLNGTPITLIRLNSDWTIDNSFIQPTINYGGIRGIFVMDNGQIIIYGTFTGINNSIKRKIARLNENGTLDLSFNTVGNSFNNMINGVNVDSNGKILVVGEFTSYNWVYCRFIARLNSNGTLDNSFSNIGDGFNGYRLYGITQLNNGKYFISGDFTYYNSTPRLRYIRFNSDWTIDNSFDINLSNAPNGNFGLALQPDGNFYCVGDFDNINGFQVRSFAKLDENGIVDTNFNPISNLNYEIHSFDVQNDGKILVGGNFNCVNNSNIVNGIFRINSSASTNQTVSTCNSYSWNGNTYTTSGTYVTNLISQSGCDSTVTLNLTINNSNSTSENITECNSYTWNGNTYTTSGIYTSNHTNINGCDSMVTLNLILNMSPTTPIITITNDTILSVSPQNGVQYQWINCDSGILIQDANEPIFSASSNGNYAVIVSNSCGSDTSNCALSMNSIFENQKNYIQLYPNPTTSTLSISGINTDFSYKISDLQGKLLKQGANDKQIEIENLPAGTYVIGISTESEVKQLRFVKL